MGPHAAGKTTVSAMTEGIDIAPEIPTMEMARDAARALERVGARRVLLYGSIARGDQAETSDFDLVAIFDDLSAESSSSADDTSVYSKASAALRDVIGYFPYDLMIRDRVEWKIRTALSSTLDHEIEKDHIVLLDLPPAVPIDWDRGITRPASDSAEAEMLLGAARQRLGMALINAEWIEHGRESHEPGREGFWRFWDTRDLCQGIAAAARVALSAYLAGVHRTRGRKTKGKGRFSEIWDEIPAHVAKRLMARMKIPPTDLDLWWEVSLFDSPQVGAIEKLTPQYGADTIDTAAFLIAFACEELSSVVLEDDLREYIDMRGGMAVFEDVSNVVRSQDPFDEETRREHLRRY